MRCKLLAALSSRRRAWVLLVLRRFSRDKGRPCTGKPPRASLSGSPLQRSRVDAQTAVMRRDLCAHTLGCEVRLQGWVRACGWVAWQRATQEKGTPGALGVRMRTCAHTVALSPPLECCLAPTLLCVLAGAAGPVRPRVKVSKSPRQKGIWEGWGVHAGAAKPSSRGPRLNEWIARRAARGGRSRCIVACATRCAMRAALAAQTHKFGRRQRRRGPLWRRQRLFGLGPPQSGSVSKLRQPCAIFFGTSHIHARTCRIRDACTEHLRAKGQSIQRSTAQQPAQQTRATSPGAEPGRVCWSRAARQ
jgi:hypothetical protein